MKKTIAAVVSCLILAAFAYTAPARNVASGRHPNLAAAQRLCAQAYQKIEAAQRANEFDLKGHGQKAKELLEQANSEIKQAAEAANSK